MQLSGTKSLRGLVLAIAILGLPAAAQNRNSGEIRGTIKDTSGTVIQDAQVVISNVLTGVVTELKTNTAGVYAATSLEPGEYSVSIIKDGFSKYTRASVALHVEAITIDVTLSVGTVNQQIVVEEEASLVQTESADRRSLLPGQTVSELPLVGRGWYDMTKLLPGVSPGNHGVLFAGA